MRYSKLFIGLLMNSLFSKLFFRKHCSILSMSQMFYSRIVVFFKNWQTVVISMRLKVAETIQICAIFKTQPWDIKMITLIHKTLSVVSSKFLRFLDDVISWLWDNQIKRCSESFFLYVVIFGEVFLYLRP